MKLTSKTLALLKNFTRFNNNVLILPGDKIKTMTPQKNVFVLGHLDQSFEREIPIYNLTEFLNAVDLFKDPDLEFGDDSVRIVEKEGGEQRSVQYAYADKSVIKFPDKDVVLPPVDMELQLTKDALNRVLHAARILSLPSLSIIPVNGRRVLRVHDASNPSSNKYDVDLGEETKYTNGEQYEVNFKIENLTLMDLDYKLSIVFRGIAEFRNDDFGVVYAVGLAPSKAPTIAA